MIKWPVKLWAYVRVRFFTFLTFLKIKNMIFYVFELLHTLSRTLLVGGIGAIKPDKGGARNFYLMGCTQRVGGRKSPMSVVQG